MHTPQDIDDAREYDTQMQRNRNPIASEVIVTRCADDAAHSAQRGRNTHPPSHPFNKIELLHQFRN